MTNNIRKARGADLDAINATIEAAVSAWPLTERVKRLSVPVLRYNQIDMDALQMLVFESAGRIVGVAAWCEHGDDPGPGGRRAFLHGLYVQPGSQNLGIGAALQRALFAAAQGDGMHAVELRAERVSVGYFEKCGYTALPPSSEPGGSYPYRFWKPLAVA